MSKEIFMTNKTLRHTSLSLLTLLAAITLAACGGNADKNTSASNQKETTTQVTTASASKTETGQKEGQMLKRLKQNKRKISKSHKKLMLNLWELGKIM